MSGNGFGARIAVITDGFLSISPSCLFIFIPLLVSSLSFLSFCVKSIYVDAVVVAFFSPFRSSSYGPPSELEGPDHERTESVHRDERFLYSRNLIDDWSVELGRRAQLLCMTHQRTDKHQSSSSPTFWFSTRDDEVVILRFSCISPWDYLVPRIFIYRFWQLCLVPSRLVAVEVWQFV